MKSTNHAVFNVIFRFVENYVSPIAGRISSQRHVMAIRDGFISAMPFMIVGSFLLVFAYPPFSPDTTRGFARARLDMAKQFEGQILTPFDMTMGIMSIYICAAIAYNPGKHYVKSHQLDRLCAPCFPSWHSYWSLHLKQKALFLWTASAERGSLRRFWWRFIA